MVKKTRSEIYKTSFPAPDVAEFTHDSDEFAPTVFPRRLNEPMRVDMELLARLDTAGKSEGSIRHLEVWSRWQASQLDELRGRWAELFAFYKINARSSEDAWRRLAISLARDFVPGLRVENVYPTKTFLDEQTRLMNVITAVASALRIRRESAQGRHHVSERTVLENDFFNKATWDTDLLGDKPGNVEAFAVRFARDKKRFAEILIDQYWSRDGLLAMFNDFGLEPPKVVTDMAPSLADLAANLPKANAS
jgi:hypothetical protein